MKNHTTTTLFLSFTCFLFVAGGLTSTSAQSTVDDNSKPIFMQGNGLGNGLYSTCRCYDKDKNITQNMEQVITCDVLLIDRRRDQEESLKFESYLKQDGGWKKTEYSLSGEVLEAYDVVSAVSWGLVRDTMYVENPETGELDEVVRVFHHMKNKK